MLSGLSHPPKVKHSDRKDVSILAGHQKPADLPKPIGEHSNNTFACNVLRDNGNEEIYKAYTGTYCIPLSHFRCLFPQLCREDGNPRNKALEPTLAQFEAYDGGILQAHGWIMLPTQDINRDKKFHSVRYYVVDREEATILISHNTATWLGLLKVQCKNKAPKIKRQVAYVSKKTAKSSNSNKNIFLSGPTHPFKVKYSLAAPPHPPKVKYL